MNVIYIMSFKLVMSRGRLAERESVRFVKCLVKGLGFDLAVTKICIMLNPDVLEKYFLKNKCVPNLTGHTVAIYLCAKEFSPSST